MYPFTDSTVLAYVLSELNRRHNYGLDLFLLSVDEGITGYRDDSLETVKRNELQVSSIMLVEPDWVRFSLLLLY
jgi:tRNA(Ile)-lysidine synthase TilS/MesJ